MQKCLFSNSESLVISLVIFSDSYRFSFGKKNSCVCVFKILDLGSLLSFGKYESHQLFGLFCSVQRLKIGGNSQPLCGLNSPIGNCSPSGVTYSLCNLCKHKVYKSKFSVLATKGYMWDYLLFKVLVLDIGPLERTFFPQS